MASGSDLIEILIKLLAEVDRRNIDYALAGGWAFSVLVEPRATTDIDLLILLDSPSQESIRSLASSVLTPTIVPSAPMKLKHISIWRCLGLRDKQEVIIDFLLADSAFLKSALARRQRIALGSQLVATLTLEDLMLMKMLAGRLQDQADLERIDSCKQELQIDWAYIDRWKAELGIARP